MRILLGGVLLLSVVAKLRRPRAAAAAMATYGFSGSAAGSVALAFVVGAETVLAVGVMLGSDLAAYLAAALMLLFAASLGSALLAGRAGAPCACFGSSSTVSAAAIARNLLLAAAFAAAPEIPGGELSTDQWLGYGLGVSLLLSAALAIAVRALARQLGMLRLRIDPASALEISHEGPELGVRTSLRGDGEGNLQQPRPTPDHHGHGRGPSLEQSRVEEPLPDV